MFQGLYFNRHFRYFLGRCGGYIDKFILRLLALPSLLSECRVEIFRRSLTSFRWSRPDNRCRRQGFGRLCWYVFTDGRDGRQYIKVFHSHGLLLTPVTEAIDTAPTGADYCKRAILFSKSPIEFTPSDLSSS